MASPNVTDLVSQLHSNIDSIYQTLNLLSNSSITHEKEISRLSADRESQIQELERKHEDTVKELALQREKEADESKRARDEEEKQAEATKQREMEELIRKHAQAADERRMRAEKSEEERLKLRQEEDARKARDKEEKEKSLRSSMEEQMERLEDELERKVEEGKKALKELDENRKAINAQIDAALNTPTVIPALNFRSRRKSGVKVSDQTADFEFTNTVQKDEHADEKGKTDDHSPSVIAKDLDEVANAPALEETLEKNQNIDNGSNYDDSVQSLDVTPIPGTMASAGALDSAPIPEPMQSPMPKADNDDASSAEQKLTSQAPIDHQTEIPDSKETPSTEVTPDPNTNYDDPFHTPQQSLQKLPVDHIDNTLRLESNVDKNSDVKSQGDDEQTTDDKANFGKDRGVNVERETNSAAGEDLITHEKGPKDPRDDSQEGLSQDTHDESPSAGNDLNTDNIHNNDDNESKSQFGSSAIQENIEDHSEIEDESEDSNQSTQNISLAITKENSFSSENGHDDSQNSAAEEDDTTLLGDGNEEASDTDTPNHLAGYEKSANPPKNVDLPTSTKDSDPKPDSHYANQSSPRETRESGPDSIQSDSKEEHPVTDRALESTTQLTESVIASHEPQSLTAELSGDRHSGEEQSPHEMTEKIIPSQASEDGISKFNKEAAQIDTMAGDQVQTSSYVADDKPSSPGFNSNTYESTQAVSHSYDITERRGSYEHQPAKSHESEKNLPEPRKEEIFSGDEDKENSNAEVSDIPASKEINTEADQYNEVLHSKDRSKTEEEDLGAEDVNGGHEHRMQKAETNEEPPRNIPVEQLKEEERQADESARTPSVDDFPSSRVVSPSPKRQGRTMSRRNSRLRSSSPLWKEVNAKDLSEQENNHSLHHQVAPTSPGLASSEYNSPLSSPNTEDGPKLIMTSKQDMPASPTEQALDRDSPHKIDELEAADPKYSSTTDEKDVDVSPKNPDIRIGISKEGQPQDLYNHSRDSSNASSGDVDCASAPDSSTSFATSGQYQTGAQQSKEPDKTHSPAFASPENESKTVASKASHDEGNPSPDTEQRRVRFSDSHEIAALPETTKNGIKSLEKNVVKEPKQSEASETSLSTPIQDRWAQIRKNAAHRAAANQEMKDKKPSVDATSSEASGEPDSMDTPPNMDWVQIRKSVADRVVGKQQAGETVASTSERSHEVPNMPDGGVISSSMTQANKPQSIEISTSPASSAPKKAWWEFRKDFEARNKDHIAHAGELTKNQRYDTKQINASPKYDSVPDIPLRSASRSRSFSHPKAAEGEIRKEADFRPQTPINHAAQAVDNRQLAESPVTVVSSDDLFADDDDESDEDFDGPHRQPPTFASIPPQKAEDSSGEQTPRLAHESNSSKEVDPFTGHPEKPTSTLTPRSSSALFPIANAQTNVPLVNQINSDSRETTPKHHGQEADDSGSEYSQDHHVLAAIEAESGETTPFYSSHSYQDPMEVPLRTRSHTTDTVPSFESFNHSDSDSPPRTPDSRSSSPFVEDPIEPTIRQSWQSSPSNITNDDLEQQELKTATAPMSADFDPYNPQVYGHLVTPKNSLAMLKSEDMQDTMSYEQSKQDRQKVGDYPLQSPLKLDTSSSSTRKRLSSSASPNTDSITNSPSRLPRRTSHVSSPTINPASATFFQKTRTLFESPITSPSRTSRPLSGIFANRTSGASSPSWKSSRPNSLSSYKTNSPARERRPTLLNEDDIIIPKSLDSDGRPPSPVDVIPTGQREVDDYEPFPASQCEPKRAGSFPLGGLMNSIHNPYRSRISTGAEREPLLRDKSQENET